MQLRQHTYHEHPGGSGTKMHRVAFVRGPNASLHLGYRLRLWSEWTGALRLWPRLGGSRHFPRHAQYAFKLSSLDVARDRDTDGEILQCDIGQGFNFRGGIFDGAISVSVIQWLCNKDKTVHEPWKRLLAFFKSVYKALKFGGRVVGNTLTRPSNSTQKTKSNLK